jgi:hypothetical protein
LSNFCKEQDESALPIFKNKEKVVFADEWQSYKEIHQVAEWNCLNKQLLSATTNIQDNEQAIQFLEKWFMQSLDLASHISDTALGKYIALGNDVLIKDVQAVLQKRGTCTRNTFLELLSIDVLLRHKLKGIESLIQATT